MVRFVITGERNSRLMAHAVHVAKVLQKRLKDFEFDRCFLSEDEYEVWLAEINAKEKWFFRGSPLIYKELLRPGSRRFLIGTLGDFLQYCYDYYGAETYLPREQIDALMDQGDIFDTADTFFGLLGLQRKIVVYGSDKRLLQVMLPALLSDRTITGDGGMVIAIYDPDGAGTTLHQLVRSCFGISDGCLAECCIVVTDLEETLGDADYFIDIRHRTRSPEEEPNDFLLRNYNEMKVLGERINSACSSNIKVILAYDGPLCFNATILNRVINTISEGALVAITADVGLRALRLVSEVTSVPLTELGLVPVWGFAGMEGRYCHVDVNHIVHSATIYRPNRRSVRAARTTTTLSVGEYLPDMRFLQYLSFAMLDLPQELAGLEKKRERFKTGSKTKSVSCGVYSRARALVDLLRVWSLNVAQDEIVSVGLPSTGAFGIPEGLCFSQPAILNEEGVFVPCEIFPCPKEQVERQLAEITDIEKKFLSPNAEDEGFTFLEKSFENDKSSNKDVEMRSVSSQHIDSPEAIPGGE